MTISTTPKINYIQASSMDYSVNDRGKKVVNNEENPVRIIKTRLAKAKVSKKEYEELRKAIEI
jgi:uncharacterized membrane protein